MSIIRLSGPEARRVAEDLCGALPDARHCYYRELRDAGELIDQILVVRFDAGSSFTGEDTVEFHLHGAPVVVRRLAAALRVRGIRQAEAGEFTMRAFVHGRMDLAEVEGLADLLAAETEAQRKLASEAASGALGRLAAEWREALTEAGAMITASIDFADEEIPDDVASGVHDVMHEVRRGIDAQIAGFPASERIRAGFEVALVGAPNAGKSSLINAIAAREVAIVTDIPGTTRDVVEFRADLRGLAVTFLDTAGLRETGDLVEIQGIRLARSRAEAADLRVFLGDVPAEIGGLARPEDLFVETKGDLTGIVGAISSVTGAGIDGLLERIYEILRSRVAGASLASHERQVEALREAASALDVAADDAPEILSERLREATFHLRRLVGKIDVEDYLDRVFSNFCVGK
ncbi:tRNA uridine-5-carboxymethylaminomethyl(34) synthesis GTPase MnmE [Paracoccus isoporae]|uniref:tRNA uridine-5-carboxymethylaminomethyl(34) synthesis GTPase MnmE n=1 Tax=Paracoccus isoporae TaxID=591205 RepID=UPI0031835E44